MLLKFYNLGGKQSWIVRYALALSLFLLALFLRFFLLPVEAGFPYLTFYPALVISFYLFGAGPSILVLALCSVASFYFFMAPFFTWEITQEAVIGDSAFIFFGILIGLIVKQINTYLAEQLRNEVELNRFKAIITSTNDAIISIDLSMLIRNWNLAAAKLYGYSEEEVIGKPLAMLVPEDSRGELFKLINRVKAGGVVDHYRAPRLCKDGKVIQVLLSLSPIKDGHGELIGISSVGHDISEQVRLEEQVRRMAFYDELTKLANRRLLDDRMSQALAANRRSRCHSALLFIDLDNFKPLNDAYGHDAGDLLLVEVAKRLKSCVREVDTVSRIGGDEFVVLVTVLERDQLLARQHALAIAEKIRLSLAETYEISVRKGKQAASTIQHQCTVSIGVVVFSGIEKTQDDILNEADAAMYEAKHAGRNAIRYSGPANSKTTS